MNNVITLPTAADKPVRQVKLTRAQQIKQQDADNMETVRKAVENGLLPENFIIPVNLAVKLIKGDGVPDDATPEFVKFNGKYVNNELKMGRLNSKPRPIALGRTTLEWYGEVVCSVKVWPDADCAQRFADYENGRLPRYQPVKNADKTTSRQMPVVWEEITASSVNGSGRDENWKVEVI